MKKILILAFLLIFISSCITDPSEIKVDDSLSNKQQAAQFADGILRVLYSADYNNVYPNLATELLVWESNETYSKDSAKAEETYSRFADNIRSFNSYEEIKEGAIIKVISTTNIIGSEVGGDRDQSQEEFEERTAERYGQSAANMIFDDSNYFVYLETIETGRLSDPFLIITKENGAWKLMSYPIY